ncbi:uncharacterized protein L969DRAFT_19841 [Mixia osmundae IAM 14324]|uniref:Multifunctional tryptophan biosynthesis protein n=1 Tax=Mixia osmundae (strain CBS 9802 / IAM 14324 / JCM 22182 / KY 12970) TaxID=764103 RepID=G7E2A8_MIXOS|nr:uncharacterized protein L969DRAFT_19841 [Mixia osmundae IAM 14324]KEI36841.1 hypothetical protein L969DRAFT_19841 [Mixia osmundae IAM 14324]GAA96968.1 hypothetical protein E5Q_03642 [Mixia osmundae IAM 14324]
MADVVLIDNADSFTWNLYEYLCRLGAHVTVYRSDLVSLAEVLAAHPQPSHLVISPGPGHPLRDSGISIPILQHFTGKVPILGVCMGLQCMYAQFGGIVDSVGEIIHGKTSAVTHDGKGIFKDVPQGIQSTRYHSLAGNLTSLPDVLEVTSRTQGGGMTANGHDVVMGIRHKVYAMEAVQYHPESILSEGGLAILNNFLQLTGSTWADNPQSGLAANKDALPKTNGTASQAPTILTKIFARRQADVAKAKRTPGRSPAELESQLELHVAPPLISFYDRLLQDGSSTADATSSQANSKVALLAEVKRASPSKGNILPPDSALSSATIGLQYATAGASAISVLTEPVWFKGCLEDMRAVRMVVQALPNRPAILRKDFIFDIYQIDEARLYGADTVLLIVAMLDDATLKKLYDHSLLRGMEPLVEVNNADELRRALAIGVKIIGVNNRNLHDFEVDMSTTSRMADVIRQQRGKETAREIILIALSGITSRTDVEQYMSQGVGAILVGESLMRSEDKSAFVRHLLGKKQNGHTAPAPSRTLVKICGVKTPEVALAAAKAGADFIGLIFAPKSKRFVDMQQARKVVDAIRQTPICDQQIPTSSNDWFASSAARLSRPLGRPRIVGVFQNAPLETVLHTVETLELDACQLHGTEPAEWAHLISVPVIRAFHVDQHMQQSDIAKDPSLAQASRPNLHALALFDTKIATDAQGLSGGAGKAFDWTVARMIADARTKDGLPALPFLLAGGIDVSNIASAIRQTQPWAVDISGGVETDGVKDIGKIEALLKAAREA